ncbi:hypothetical protein C1C98_22805 [Pseudomonas ogarae]|uniref:Uncharacterized protein n=1 Tax=Pseudomonas ogarae (strain DSM 112162 / CECT 30235 / F113) TaxID=1114970 RepID=A0ABN5GA05_PSEO1|nr:hypothetical protein C1C98_22805 [Pseudomonas ogarae]
MFLSLLQTDEELLFCGSELARDSGGSAPVMLAVLTSSRASSLPQGEELGQIALWVFSQPNPASVVVSGLYSQPIQPV